jgi:topoisomerase-4 subunit A
MNQTPPPSDATPDPTPVSLRDALEERYLAYALSTIMHHALPDVRDGLDI